MKTENVIFTKSKAFALRIIKLYQFLKEAEEFILSKQVMRSGTSIGANVCEALHGQSKSDFYAKLYVAYKEAGETAYWLELLYEGGFISKEAFNSIYADCKELVRLLAAITKTQKTNC